MSVHEDVLQAAKDMLKRGLTAGTSGNVSGRLDNDQVVITPSSLSYEDMTLDDLVVLDMDGKVVDGQRSASSEKGVHLACYRKFDEIGSVIHTHPIYVGGEVPVCEYAMSGTDQLGENAASVLDDVGTALLASHGMVSIGPNPDRTLHQAGVVERAAQVVWGARSLGGPVPLPEKVNRDFAGVYKLMFRGNTQS
jgi:L-fuculose-phosphate aldolase